MSAEEVGPKDRGTILAEERTELAVRRSKLAEERTLMAWIRTALSMIGSGFAIVKFFQYLPAELASGTIKRPYAPRNLGLTLIALGTVALAVATWQHRRFLSALSPSEQKSELSISFVIAIAVIFVGILVFYGVLLKHGPF